MLTRRLGHIPINYDVFPTSKIHGGLLTRVNAEVLALVERELRLDPGLSSTELRKRAVELDQSIEELSGRQFHAQYTIQVRKRLSTTGSKVQSPADRPVVQLLESGYEERRAALEAAIDAAFQRALTADSLTKINRLFSTLEKHRQDLESV